MLALGRLGKGRVLTYMSDPAPHWAATLFSGINTRILAPQPRACPWRKGMSRRLLSGL